MRFLTTLVVLCCVWNCSYVSCDTVIPCKLTEENCLEKTIVEIYSKFIIEDPELGTESLDPMHHDLIEGNFSILKYTFKNTTVTGFKNCKIENVKLDAELHLLHIELLCPKLVMSGHYDIHGRLVIVPVEGNGDFRVETNKYRISVDADLKLRPGEDGKTYMSIKNFKQTSEPLETVKFDFKNLFNGQKDLADTVLKFANENWFDVAKEVQEPIFEEDIKKLIKNANKYFIKSPLEDLILL